MNAIVVSVAAGVGIAGSIVGIIVGTTQMLEYLQRRRSIKSTAVKAALTATSEIETAHSNAFTLPARGEFAGRREEIERLQETLRSRSRMICIEGIGGIGKTSLALEVVYDCMSISEGEPGWFSQVAWISCKGLPLSGTQFLTQLAEALDYPNLADPKNKRGDIMKLILARKPYLLILDSFQPVGSAEVEALLLNLPEPSKVIITSRQAIHFASDVLHLNGLTENESVQLIRMEAHRLGLSSLEEAPVTMLAKVCSATGGAPMAIKWVLGQVRQGGQSLEIIINRLEAAHGDIFKHIFEDSWRLLPEDSRLVILALSTFVARTRQRFLEATTGLSSDRFEVALTQLLEMSLVTADAQWSDSYYSLHQLTRLFVGAKLNADKLLKNSFLAHSLQEYLSFVLESIDSGWTGYSNLASERENVLAATYFAYRDNWKVAKQLTVALKWFLWDYGLWSDLLTLYQYGLKEAQLVGDDSFIVRCHKEIAWVRCRQGEFDQAASDLAAAGAASSGTQASSVDHADIIVLSALIDKSRGNVDSAKGRLEEALTIYREEKYSGVEVLRLMTYLGEVAMSEGDSDLATKWFHDTLEMAQLSDQRAAIAWSLDNLGRLALSVGHDDEAVQLLQDGLTAAEAISRHHTIANCAYALGKLNQREGNLDASLRYLRRALDVSTRKSRGYR